MRKKVGIIKRLFTLLLVFLLSINSFAAIVSDNDGSAFITKAEFDALKSSFQAQIDSYNQSIDSKIDGAIASYLAGIRLSKEFIQQDILGTVKVNGNPVKWSSNDSGAVSTQKTSSGATSTRQVTVTLTAFALMRYAGWLNNALSGGWACGDKHSSSYRIFSCDDSDYTSGKFHNLYTCKLKNTMTMAYHYLDSGNQTTFNDRRTSGMSHSGFTCANLAGTYTEGQTKLGAAGSDSSGSGGRYWSSTWSLINENYNSFILYPRSTTNETIIKKGTSYVVTDNKTYGEQVNLSGRINGDRDDAYEMASDGYFGDMRIDLDWKFSTASGVASNAVYSADWLSIEPTLKGARYGLPVFKADHDGTYVAKFNTDKKGYLVGIITNATTTSHDFYSSSKLSDLSNLQSKFSIYKNVTTVGDFDITGNVSKDDTLWVCFLPTSTSDNALLKLVEAKITADD